MSSIGIPQHWRTIRERYRLLGSHCDKCGSNYFPPRKVCPRCRRRGKIVQVEFSGKGKIYSYTIVNASSKSFEQYLPYIIGLVELDEGPRVLTQIVDCKPEDLRIGMKVEACFRKIFEQEDGGIISYGFKFRPYDDSWINAYESNSRSG